MMNQIPYHPVEVTPDTRIDVAVGTAYTDPISQAIADHAYTFPPALRLSLELLQPGWRVLDLGAHIGTFSLAAAALGCRVVAVEASPYNADLLNASIARNRFSDVRVVAAAVSDHRGTLEFVQGGPFGFVSNPVMGETGITVPAITVDDLLADLEWERCDFIKMDVEGSEVSAVRGMSQLLSRPDAPAILYESNGHTLRFFAQTPNSLIAALEAFGYRNYRVEPGRLIPVRSGELQPECNVDYLAAKQLPGAIPGWQFANPSTPEETVVQVLSSCVHPLEHCRAYAARALADADPSLLLDERVVHALMVLCTDPVPDVRAAASWFNSSQAGLTIQLRLCELLESQADTMLRGYSVRSHVPVVGGLIAWIRRNLTSHLREPYLDPTLERQVTFNRLIAIQMRQLVALQADLLNRLTSLEARLGGDQPKV